MSFLKGRGSYLSKKKQKKTLTQVRTGFCGKDMGRLSSHYTRSPPEVISILLSVTFDNFQMEHFPTHNSRTSNRWSNRGTSGCRRQSQSGHGTCECEVWREAFQVQWCMASFYRCDGGVTPAVISCCDLADVKRFKTFSKVNIRLTLWKKKKVHDAKHTRSSVNAVEARPWACIASSATG